MSQFICYRGLSSLLKIANRTSQYKRELLTKAFWCDGPWDRHCQHKLLDLKSSNISLEEYSVGLERNFQNTNWKNKPSGVDIDIYACNVREKYLLKKLEDLVKRFRATRRCIEVLPSTWHAFIRLYLKNGLHDSLYKVLSDPINYGIFAQPHDFCLIYDYLLENKDYLGAAKMAHIQMLQEDFDSNALCTHMALYSVLKYLVNPSPWGEEEPETQKEEAQATEGMEEEEIQVVRVPYLYEPYEDSHFDLKDSNLILGKTLNLAGMATDSPAGRACQIWGVGMYGKWEEATTIDLPQLVEAGKPVLTSGVENFRKCFSQVEDPEVKEKWEGKLEALLSQLKTVPGDILPAVEADLKQQVAEESQYISVQERVFQDWAAVRQEMWDKQIEAYEMAKRRRLVEQRRQEIKEKEELLNFFNNWDKIHMELAEVTALTDKLQKETEEEYIVPEVKAWQRKLLEKEKEQDHISNANFE